MSKGSDKVREPAPATWGDEPTIVWSPPDWDPEDAKARAAETQRPGSAPARPAQSSYPDVEQPAPAEPRAPMPSDPGLARPEVEVQIRSVSNSAALSIHRKRVYELWTKNRVYSLDASLTCVEVIDLASGRPNNKHPFIGARLAGGQMRSQEQSTELSFPLPAVGAEAVFQKSDSRDRIRLAVTSPVTRVILHVQRAKVAIEERDKAWGRITR